MENQISTAIIGGGAVGCAIALELAGNSDDIFLIEKNPGITRGENQSSRNSGVIHSGIYYDQESRPQKAGLCVEGNRMLYDFCGNHRVPAIKTGKLIVANSAEEEDVLGLYLERSKHNLVPGVERVSGEKVTELEPNVKARSALIVPTAGIVEPTSLVYRLFTLASKKGVQFLTGTEVVGLEGDGDFIRLNIRYPDGNLDDVRAGVVINSAGTDADRLALMLNSRSPYELDPVKGEAYKFYGHKRPELALKGMNVYPTPVSVITPHGRHFTVGVHLTPTFEDLSYPPVPGSTVTVGPGLVPVEDRNDWTGTPGHAGLFAEKVSPFFPGIRKDDLTWHQAGLQARLKDYPDFIIEADPSQPNMINLLGIDSPGLTSCLAIARRVKGMVEDVI
ncbi:NAD(P)/FAD-dependent oxidoreductase [Thermodesulfobacteriota bacterium]